jgi:hypothetical protein
MLDLPGCNFIAPILRKSVSENFKSRRVIYSCSLKRYQLIHVNTDLHLKSCTIGKLNLDHHHGMRNKGESRQIWQAT